MSTLIATVLLFFICRVAQTAEPIPLRAGPLTMVFDADNAFLRYVKLGPHEVLRGINAPIRDQFWNTIHPEVTNVELDNQGNHFTLEYDVSCRERDIDFHWHGTILGSAEGTIELIFDGQARSTFLRSRIGFCVLHGPSVAGRPWIVNDTKGKESEGRFPTFILPDQPAKDIRAVTHEVTSGVWARVEFAGDVFEMEDQRNWTDASFKTYCTPLSKPRPVRVMEGTTISQRILLSLEGDVNVDVAGDVGAVGINEQPNDHSVLLTLGEQKSPLTGIGLQISSEVPGLSKVEYQRLRALKLNHLRVDLTPADSHFSRILRRATIQAKELNLPLHAGLNLGDDPEDELSQIAAELSRAEQQRVGPPISVWLIKNADQALLQRACKYLKPHCDGAIVGVGRENFVDLNRARPEGEPIKVVSYGVNPQIHAFDNSSIVETLPIQGDTVRSARQFIDNRRLLVGPITLRPQPVSGEPAPGQLPSNVDVRQTSMFAAGWTLGSIKYLSEAGTDQAIYYETVGWKGIMEADTLPPRQAEFPSRPGEVFPIYHVLRAIADFAGGEVTDFVSSDALSVVGLALSKDSRMRLLVANVTNKEQRVEIPGLGGSENVWTMDSQNLTQANVDPEAFYKRSPDPARQKLPLVLPPHSIVRIDR